jgi:transposase InsO family protein
MSKARLVITAVTVEKRPVSEVARAYGVARSWIYTLLSRYQVEGEAAFEPRPRRPKSSPSAIGGTTADLIVWLRKELSGRGLDAGPHTIAWHLRHHHQLTVSAATISRYLTRAGLVTPEPKKRPRSSYIRFAAELPNECWQSDFTHYRLTRPDGRPGADAEILGWLDDHSRLVLSLTCHRRVTGPTVLDSFRAACGRYGVPTSTLTDNGMVFTTRLSGGRGGRNGLEHELRRLGVTQKNGKPNHPQTQGKVERLWQTLKKWLAAQPAQPADLAQLQALLDAFTSYYNTRRPHRSLPHRATPATAYAARPKASPGDRAAGTHDRVRTDITGATGTVPLRTGGKLYHIGIGRAYAGTHIIMLVRTWASASSTPPPASCSATSPSTQAGTTSPPDARPDPRPAPGASPSTPNPDVGARPSGPGPGRTATRSPAGTPTQGSAGLTARTPGKPLPDAVAEARAGRAAGVPTPRGRGSPGRCRGSRHSAIPRWGSAPGRLYPRWRSPDRSRPGSGRG